MTSFFLAADASRHVTMVDQGQFVSLVADVARLDGGVQTVREYLPKVRLALHSIEQLRARSLVQNYQHEEEAPERFRGILAPSISHEGYDVPTHSYWDDYWALKGLHDGARLAAALGGEASSRALYAREERRRPAASKLMLSGGHFGKPA